jgi:hypothetical protein
MNTVRGSMIALTTLAWHSKHWCALRISHGTGELKFRSDCRVDYLLSYQSTIKWGPPSSGSGLYLSTLSLCACRLCRAEPFCPGRVGMYTRSRGFLHLFAVFREDCRGFRRSFDPSFRLYDGYPLTRTPQSSPPSAIQCRAPCILRLKPSNCRRTTLISALLNVSYHLPTLSLSKYRFRIH